MSVTMITAFKGQANDDLFERTNVNVVSVFVMGFLFYSLLFLLGLGA